MRVMNSTDGIDLVFKAIAVAMSIAVVTLNLLHAASSETQGLLLGIGLFALALTAMQQGKD